MKIAAIVAVSENGIIGKNGHLPWAKIPEDLKRFKELTTGHAVIMGRKTKESLPVFPLPNRGNLVISSKKGFWWQNDSISDALNKLINNAYYYKAFLIGGEQIYREGLQYCDEVYLTRVHGTVEYGPDDVVARFDIDSIFSTWGLSHTAIHPLGRTPDGRARFYRYSRIR